MEGGEFDGIYGINGIIGMTGGTGGGFTKGIGGKVFGRD